MGLFTRWKKKEDLCFVHVETMEVTYKPLGRRDKTPEELKLIGMVHERIMKDPEWVVQELPALIEKYPRLREFPNYLATAYKLIGDYRKATEWNMLAYERFPDYLFARCGYAMELMNMGKFKQVVEVMGNAFTLVAMYPERRCFHVTEVRAHSQCMLRYFHLMKDFKTARIYEDLLRDLDRKRCGCSCS